MYSLHPMHALHAYACGMYTVHYIWCMRRPPDKGDQHTHVLTSWFGKVLREPDFECWITSNIVRNSVDGPVS